MSYYEERSTAFLVQNDMVESVKKQKTFLLSPKNIFWGSINSSVRFEDMIERAVWCCWNSSKQARIWLQLFLVCMIVCHPPLVTDDGIHFT